MYKYIEINIDQIIKLFSCVSFNNYYKILVFTYAIIMSNAELFDAFHLYKLQMYTLVHCTKCVYDSLFS